MNTDHIYNLLVIDDEIGITKSLFRQFRKEYNVFTANSAQDALTVMENNNIQLVISDQRMPGMTGLDFFSSIKKKYPDAIKIMLSGYSDIEAVIGAINEGQVYRYITKPWNSEELSKLLKDAIQKYEIITNNKRLFNSLEERKQAEIKLKAANKELRFQNEEKEKRAAELIIALKELRQKAEKKYKKKQTLNTGTLSEVDSLKLVQELEVYQIELEMQNEQLQLAKEKAETNAEKYTNLYDFAPTGYLTLDRNSRICELNFSGAKMIGKERSKLIDNNFNLFVTQETLMDYNNFLDKVFADKSKETCEVGISINNNPTIFVHIEGIISENEQNCFLTFIDITKKKETEEKLKESKEKYRTVADYTYDWEYWIDTNGNFVYISPSCKRITGYKPDDFLNNKELMKEIIHPDDVNIIQSHKHAIDKNGERSPTEFRIITKQNKIRWIGHLCQNIIATNGKLLGIRGSNRDITDRKKTEQALLKSEAELKELNATKDKLFSVIAHDLRSPFNHIVGFSELLVENLNNYKAAEAEKFLGIINSSAKNTLILLDNLLNWAKSQTGQINFNPENQVSSSIFKGIIELLNPSAKNKNIVLNYFQSEEIIVFADLNMIKTILRNLISNAIKFTNSNGKIDVYALQNDNFIEIAVSDNGVGMNEENRNKLFRLKTNKTTIGTANEIGSGLGLVLCKEFVEKHDGKIWVESELGKGSVFKFKLPLKKLNK